MHDDALPPEQGHVVGAGQCHLLEPIGKLLALSRARGALLILEQLVQ